MHCQLAEIDTEILACYRVMAELRPHLPEQEFVARVRRQQHDGYRLVFLDEAGEVRAVAGFRFSESLAWGKYLYVDDLVSRATVRSRSYGQELFKWLIDCALGRAVADHGAGYRVRGATAVRQGAAVGLRITPTPCPVETAAGQACARAAWRCQGRAEPQEGQGWCVHDAQRYAVRVLAARLPPAAAARARQRQYRPAQQPGRTPSAATVALADGVLVATTLADDWSLSDVLRLSRARWHVARVLTPRQQLRRFNQLRRTHRTTVAATVRAILVAWPLPEDLGAASQALLRALTSPHPVVLRRWLVTGMGLETLRHQVQNTWSRARLRLCLPRLPRFLCCRPRRRAHQETAVRAWLEGRVPRTCLLEEDAAGLERH